MTGVIVAMLDQLPQRAVAELERALTLRLHPAPTPAERRVAELGLLARMLGERARPSGGPAPRIARATYEAIREREQSGAPSAAVLADNYGGWRKASIAAHGLLADGRYQGVGKPWATPSRGRSRIHPYTRAELHDAIRRCALSLGRFPTARDYHWWSRETRRLLRARGVRLEQSLLPQHRVPGIDVAYRFYPTGTNRFLLALTDAGIDEYTIAVARNRRLLASLELPAQPVAPLAAFAALTRDAALSSLPDSQTVARIESDGFGWLPLHDAAQIARALGASLDWLAGRTVDRGSPFQDEAPTLDRQHVAQLMRKCGVTPTQLRGALDLAAGPYRRIVVNGSDEPTLAELAILGSVLNTTTDRLATASR